MNFISSAYAQQQPAAPGAPAPGGAFGMFLPLIIVFIIFYFLVFRPQQKQQKQRRQMLANLKRGDEVVTNGGIYGKIADLTDTVAHLQIANNVTIKVDRAQIGNLASGPAVQKS